MITKDKNMTFDDLIKLPHLNKDCKDGQTSLLGLWIKANEDGDTKMVDLTMDVMVEKIRLKGGLKVKDNRGVPMCGGTPGHSRELLRRIDLREKG